MLFRSSWPVPEQVVQYYRASSFALSLDGYNNTAALPSNAPASNDSSPVQMADTPFPSGLNTTFLECVNSTTAASVPLLDASKKKFSPAEITGLIFAGIAGAFFLGCLLYCVRSRCKRSRKERKQRKKYAMDSVPSIRVADSEDKSFSTTGLKEVDSRPTSAAKDRWSYYPASNADVKDTKDSEGLKTGEQLRSVVPVPSEK